ncbi:ABC transporter ATP-binding protein [Haliscomenobacter sp.]|uniref:ABC transporter ATP-binding protein n=1 Tax=Haliscomenobacter sp. TaxID=2717303 RepID=UPI0033650237
MGTIFKFSNTSVKIGSQLILEAISLEIKEKEIVAIVGNNGAGKTTLLSCMLHIIPFYSGEIEIFGIPLTKSHHAYKSRVGAFLNDTFLLEELKVEEYLAFTGRFQGLSKEQVKTRSLELMDVFDVGSMASTMIKKLSKGNYVKVGLIAAMLHNPECLILDEPFVHLDMNTVEILKKVVLNMKGKKTIVITSHDLDALEGLATRYIVMDKGKIIHDIEADKHDFLSIKEQIKKQLVENADAKAAAISKIVQ